mgnify:CR=1 FL=1
MRHRSLWGVFLILIAVAVVVTLTSGIGSGVTMLLVGSVLFVSLAGAIRSVTGGLRPVTAAFYMFWFAWLGVAPAVQLTLGRVAWGDARALTDPTLVQTALLLNCGGLLAFWLGENLARWRDRRAAASKRPDVVVRKYVLQLLSITAVIVGANAIRQIGLTTLFSTRQQRAEALRTSGISLESSGGVRYALYTILPSALSIGLLLLAVIAIRRNWTGPGHVKVSESAALTVGIIGCALFANPFTQTRFITLTAIGSVLIAVFMPRSTRAGITYLTIGLVAALLVYPLADAFRHGRTSLRAMSTETFATADFDGFQQVINTIRFVMLYGHSDGVYTLSSLLFFVPRAAWEGKATPASLDVAQSAGYSFTNLSLPLHAELYLDFGAIGMVLCMSAIGFGVSRLDHAWLTAQHSRLAMMVPFAAVAVIGFLRGPLGSIVPAFVPVLVIIAALLTTKSPNESAVPSATGRLTAPERARGALPTGLGRG